MGSAQVLVEKIRRAHFANGRPFEAIGFANHGGAMWRLAADCEEEMGSPTFLFDVQAVMSAMVAALSQSGRKADNRIDLLGCDLLYHDPLMVVKLQDFYGVNFTASTDKTGNPQAGGDWVMESDGVDITHSYFDLHKLKRFAETLSLKTSLSALQDKVMDYVPIVGTVLRNAAEGAVDLAIKKSASYYQFCTRRSGRGPRGGNPIWEPGARQQRDRNAFSKLGPECARFGVYRRRWTSRDYYRLFAR